MIKRTLLEWCKENNREDIVAEWDSKRNGDLSPDEITPGSNKKIQWICPVGHSYDMTPAHRKVGQSCPYCSNKKAQKGYNDLASQFPEIVSEQDYKRTIQ